jgi:alkylation response protein AidB-like acyl-CoA dehydrogenase
MYLALEPDEQEIVRAAADFLGREFPLERLHGEHDDEAGLAGFAELGWLGLSAPESVGGSALGIVEEMLLFQQLGRVVGPFGVLPQILAVGAAQDNADIAGELLGARASVALLVERDPEQGIRGIGDARARYALEVSPDSATLFELSRGQCTDVPCLDRSVTMFTGPYSALSEVARREGGDTWLQAQVDVSAMLLGIAGRALDMIVEYAKTRETFGRAIGAYQAVRHPCADMAVRVESTRCQLLYAATALKSGHADAGMHVDAAKLVAVRAAQANTDANIQLHGGIGVTDEFSAHLLLKRANLLWRLFGASRHSTQSLLQVEEGG